MSTVFSKGLKSLTGLIASMAITITPAASLASDTPPSTTQPIKVVTSFSILADMVEQVGGDAVSVTSLVGPDEDAHVFDPSPSDARALAGADIVVINGLYFEGWIDRLIKSSGFKGQLVVASDGIVPIDVSQEDDHEKHDSHDSHDKHDHDKHDHDKHGHDEHSHDKHAHHAHHDHGDVDPHAWQSLDNGRVYIQNIQDALVQVRPSLAGEIVARTDIYLQELDALNQKTKDRFNQIPKQDRRVIASHDAFAYFGRAYGVEFFSLQGLSTEQEPSAADIARLIREIKHDDIRALLVENMSDPRLLERVAEETGARVGGELYSDALSPPGTAADTYLKMFAHNADLIWSTLQQ